MSDTHNVYGQPDKRGKQRHATHTPQPTHTPHAHVYLLAPPVEEVLEHVPRGRAFDSGVDVVPRLPRAPLGIRRAAIVAAAIRCARPMQTSVD
jgi:hypothetical protein